jgi:polysaccharide pyruvyl transferase WcaK-like protein
MEVNRRMQYERLPADVRANVVWREQYWLTDEALSTYVRSAGIIGHEMHSPIMALGNGVPALVARWEEQTSKGAMWRDIGLGDWLFDFDQAEDRARYPAAAVAWARTLGGTARTRVSTAQAVVTAYQRASIDRVRALISLPAAALPGEVRVERAAAG